AAGLTGDRLALSFALVADFAAARLGGLVVHRFAVTRQDYAINFLGNFPANPAAAKILQHRQRITIDGIAETAATGDVVDEQAALGQRNSFRHAGGEKRFTPFAGAHLHSRWMLACSYFVEHFQAGLDHHAGGADAGGKAAGETEPALGDAAVGFVVDAAVFRTVDEIDSIAAHAAAILTEATAVAVMRAREVEKRILHLDAF